MPAEPETFTPSGSAAIGPGYQDPFYYSYDAGPDELRSLDLNDGPTRWFAETSDERIDEVASNSCVATQELNPGDTAEVVDGVLLGVFSPDDLAAYAPEELAEIYSAANLVYCPGLQEYLLEVIDAIPE